MTSEDTNDEDFFDLSHKLPLDHTAATCYVSWSSTQVDKPSGVLPPQHAAHTQLCERNNISTALLILFNLIIIYDVM